MEDYSLTILGCSSATPNSRRFPSSQVLHVRGKYYLLDCGEGAQIQLRRARVSFEGLDTIFISHLHGDHFFGIFGLLSSMSLMGRKQKLTIYAPQGLKEMILFQFEACGQKILYPIEFVELKKEPFYCLLDAKNFSIHAIQLNHRVDSWGFYFTEKERDRNIEPSVIEKYGLNFEDIKNIKQGRDFVCEDGTVVKNQEMTKDPVPPFSYAYISDTLFKPEIAQYIQNVSLMYHEATFLENLADLAVETHHSTAHQAAECAKLANAEKLIIGHFSSRYKNLDKHLQDAQSIFENTELANDLCTYTVRKPAYSIWP